MAPVLIYSQGCCVTFESSVCDGKVSEFCNWVSAVVGDGIVGSRCVYVSGSVGENRVGDVVKGR